MTIRDLIAEKRKQIGVLERHIKTLEQMATEEGRLKGLEPRSGRSIKAPGRRGARRAGRSRAAMVEAYLKEHSGPQAAREMASALGLKAGQLHGAINSGLKTGRFVRGTERATFALGHGATGARRARSKRARRGRKKPATETA